MFHSYIPPITNIPSSSGSIDSAVTCTKVEDSTISLNDEGNQRIASLSEDGLKCDRERFPEKTSKEFAELVYSSLSLFLRDVQFERGKNPVKFTIQGKVLLDVTDTQITLHAAGAMTHFDQWVFIHLEKLWKERTK